MRLVRGAGNLRYYPPTHADSWLGEAGLVFTKCATNCAQGTVIFTLVTPWIGILHLTTATKSSQWMPPFVPMDPEERERWKMTALPPDDADDEEYIIMFPGILKKGKKKNK